MIRSNVIKLPPISIRRGGTAKPAIDTNFVDSTELKRPSVGPCAFPGPSVSALAPPVTRRAARTSAHPPRIAFTGGACGGKSTAMQYLKGKLEACGYHVYLVPEAATILIDSGVVVMPGPDKDKNFVKQDSIVSLQALLEDAAIADAQNQADRVVVLCDRGVPDSKAFAGPDIFARLCEKHGWTEQETLARYDAVLHLVSVAVDHPGLYGNDNNPAREGCSADLAKDNDEQLMSAWAEHPQRFVIHSRGVLQDKLQEIEGVVKEMLASVERTKTSGASHALHGANGVVMSAAA